jgi:hypothetical protein
MDTQSILILRGLVAAKVKHLDEQIALTQAAYSMNHPVVCELRAQRVVFGHVDHDLVALLPMERAA